MMADKETDPLAAVLSADGSLRDVLSAGTAVVMRAITERTIRAYRQLLAAYSEDELRAMVDDSMGGLRDYLIGAGSSQMRDYERSGVWQAEFAFWDNPEPSDDDLRALAEMGRAVGDLPPTRSGPYFGPRGAADAGG